MITTVHLHPALTVQRARMALTSTRARAQRTLLAVCVAMRLTLASNPKTTATRISLTVCMSVLEFTNAFATAATKRLRMLLAANIMTLEKSVQTFLSVLRRRV